MKKGFTLIELLAVILILGIIALIAIPTVNKIIAEARYGAFKSGNENIIKQVEQDCQTSIMKGENPTLSYLFTEGKSSNEINIKGSLPNDGYILLDRNCTVTNYYLSDEKNVYSNEEDARLDYMLKASEEEETSIFKTMYSDYFDNIISVNLINNINIPENAIEIKDPSISGNNKIRSWLVPNGEFYDLYIGSEKIIYANYNSAYLFNKFKNITNIDLTNIDTSFTNNMEKMFSGLHSLENIDLSKIKTDNVENMKFVFYQCYLLRTLDLLHFNTSNVTTMGEMFRECKNLETILISNWDTSKLENIYCLFNQCSSLKSIDISKWNTKNLKFMRYAFFNCSSLLSIDISNWNTINLMNSSRAFELCQSLKEINLSNWNTTNLESVEGMFSQCNSLEKLNLQNWNFNKITYYDELFRTISLLKSVIISDFRAIGILEEHLPSKTVNSPGIITFKGDKSSIDTSILNSKNWNVV